MRAFTIRDVTDDRLILQAQPNACLDITALDSDDKVRLQFVARDVALIHQALSEWLETGEFTDHNEEIQEEIGPLLQKYGYDDSKPLSEWLKARGL